MTKKPNLVDYQTTFQRKRQSKKMNNSFYKNRGEEVNVQELTPFRGTQDSKGFAFDRGGTAEDIPRESFYNDGDADEDQVKRVMIIQGEESISRNL